MTINAVAMNIGCSARAILHHRQRFQATRRVVKTAIFGKPTCAIASKLPQLLLLTRNIYGTHNNRISTQTVRNRFQTATATAANT